MSPHDHQGRSLRGFTVVIAIKYSVCAPDRLRRLVAQCQPLHNSTTCQQAGVLSEAGVAHKMLQSASSYLVVPRHLWGTGSA